MPNRFSLKDLIIIVLLVAIGAALIVSMLQRDRQWDAMRRLETKVDETNARMNEAASKPAAPAQREASWARPDVRIDWQPSFGYATDPTSQPGYQSGGEFTELWEGSPSAVTPFVQADAMARRAIDLVCDVLGAFDPKTLELRGVLVDAWQYAPDGKWLRVHLRPEATFSDGVPVTAEDVRFTFQDIVLNPLIEAGDWRDTLDMIEDVAVIDDHTVEFKFSKVLFTNLDATLNVNILPKHFYEKFEPSQINQSTSLLMGSGRFRLEALDPNKQWKPGDDFVLVRNERYWNRAAAAPLARMRFKIVSDESGRVVAFNNGDGDLVSPADPQFAAAQRAPDWSKTNRALDWVNMRSQYSFIAWQCGKRKGERLTPFHDKRVRQAMTMLLNREQMIADIWDGIGQVAKGPFSPDSPATDAALAPWPFDLEGAKKLLAEAGWIDRDNDGTIENEKGEPFEFEFTLHRRGDLSDRLANFVKNACLKAGVRCRPNIVEWSAVGAIRAARDFDALYAGWQAGAPESDVRQMFHSNASKGNGNNFMQWSNKEADDLMNVAASTLEPAERMKVWHQFGKVVHDEQPYTFLRCVPWLRFVKKNVGNVNTYKTGLEMWEFFRPAAASPTL